jgi:hypothetical protein
VQVNPDNRLGCHGAQELKQHPWFASVDWQLMEAHKVEPPFEPKLTSINDMSNFANYDAEMMPPPPNTRSDRNLWSMWEWVDTNGLQIHGVTAKTKQ